MASAILPREIKTWWRHVTTPPNPHERTSALPCTSKRAEVSPPLQSVRASVDGCRASPCTHARSEVAHRGWDLLSGVRQHPGLHKKVRFFSTCCSPFYTKFVVGNGRQTRCHHVSGSGGCDQDHREHLQGEWNRSAHAGISALDRRCMRMLWV